jgi:hypothetical protein
MKTMIDNVLGLSCAFTYAREHHLPAEQVTNLALRLVRADMGHPAVARYLPPAFPGIVKEARQWLREAQEVITGERPRTWDAARA